MKMQIGDIVVIGSEFGTVKALVEGFDAVELNKKVAGYKFWSTEGLATIKSALFENKQVLAIYELAVPAYVYTGRAYEYGSAGVKVLATSLDDACQILNKHKSDVEKWLNTQPARPSFKPLIKPESKIEFKPEYHGKKTGLKVSQNVLTSHGGFKRVGVASK